jgi:hypothetical protein
MMVEIYESKRHWMMRFGENGRLNGHFEPFIYLKTHHIIFAISATQT